jgi:hypothetical protein
VISGIRRCSHAKRKHRSKSIEIKGENSKEFPRVEQGAPRNAKQLIFVRQHGEQGLPSKHGSEKKENISGSVSEVKQKKQQRREDGQTTTANQNLIYTSSSP